jgi:hypothetical protein
MNPVKSSRYSPNPPLVLFSKGPLFPPFSKGGLGGFGPPPFYFRRKKFYLLFTNTLLRLPDPAVFLLVQEQLQIHPG